MVGSSLASDTLQPLAWAALGSTHNTAILSAFGNLLASFKQRAEKGSFAGAAFFSG